MQVGLCLHQCPFGAGALHGGGGFGVDVVDHVGRVCQHAQHPREGEVGKMGGRGVQQVFAEGELGVRQAQLGQEGGGQVVLGTIGVDAAGTGHGSTGKDEGNTVTLFVKVAQRLGVCALVVGNQDDKRALPLGQAAELADEVAHATVGIGEGIAAVVLQTAVGHLEGLVAAGCLQDAVGGTGRCGVGTEVVQKTVEDEMVVHTPFAQALGDREVAVADYVFEAG